MGKNKLKKFAENKAFAHFIQPANEEAMRGDHALKGRWHEAFGNDNPIVLELACGKGEYSVGMGEIFPDKNFIGMDVKGARMYSGAREVQERGLKNVRFLRTKIDFITSFFAPSEVSEVWVLFADPQPQKPRKRLTSELFLNRYTQLLKTGGTLHLKTDSDELYEFTKTESVPQFNQGHSALEWQPRFDTDRLYEQGIAALDPIMQRVMNIRTHYEQMWLAQGKTIKYLSYQLQKK